MIPNQIFLTSRSARRSLRLYPKTHARMLSLGALTAPELSPIFERFFLPLLPPPFVHRIFDIFLLEGSKAIFRFGLALVGCFKTRLKKIDFNRPGVFWWDQVSAGSP